MGGRAPYEGTDLWQRGHGKKIHFNLIFFSFLFFVPHWRNEFPLFNENHSFEKKIIWGDCSPIAQSTKGRTGAGGERTGPGSLTVSNSGGGKVFSTIVQKKKD